MARAPSIPTGWITTPEAAKLLRERLGRPYSLRGVQKLLSGQNDHAPPVRSIRVGRSYLVDRDSLLAYAASAPRPGPKPGDRAKKCRK